MTIKITTEIKGNNEVSNFLQSELITVEGKTELTLNDLVDTDGIINIPFNKVGDISKIMINCPSCNLVINGTIIIPISGMFIWSVNPSFISSIMSIGISTDSTSALDCYILILGV